MQIRTLVSQNGEGALLTLPRLTFEQILTLLRLTFEQVLVSIRGSVRQCFAQLADDNHMLRVQGPATTSNTDAALCTSQHSQLECCQEALMMRHQVILLLAQPAVAA